jgi:hypothetical protein
VSELRRATGATDSYRSELVNKIKYIKVALIDAPNNLNALSDQVFAIENRLNNVNIKMNGDASLSKREFETKTSINSRISIIEGTLWNVSSAPTQTFIQSYDVASKLFAGVLSEIKSIDAEIKKMEDSLELNKAPYTPGRLPDWKEK